MAAHLRQFSLTITGLGHGTPLASDALDGCGSAGPFLIETQISSTALIASFWGITPALSVSARKPSVKRLRKPAIRVQLVENPVATVDLHVPPHEVAVAEPTVTSKSGWKTAVIWLLHALGIRTRS